MSIFRAYFYDLTTRKELVDHPLNGKTWLGTSAMARDAKGEFIKDTCTFVEVAAFANLRTVKDIRTVTAADFEGPVAVKVWYGPDNAPEWRKLV